MFLLSITCLSGFLSAASTLIVAPQDSIITISDIPTSSSNTFELLSPWNKSTPWPTESFPPAHPPSLTANISALKALGLDADKPISWEMTPSGVTMGLQCNIRYGRRLDFQDCRNAYSYIPRSDERVARFAERHSETPHDISLPQRVLGGVSSRRAPFLPSFIASVGTEHRH